MEPGLDEEVSDPFQNVTIRGNSQKCRVLSEVEEYSLQGETALSITSAVKEYVSEQMSTFTQQLLSKIDALASSIKSFNSRVSSVEERISAVEKRLNDQVDAKVNDLSATVDRLKLDLNNRDQELLQNDIEISGVFEMKGENPVHVATMIGNKLGVKIHESDVVSAVRVGARRDTFSPPSATRPTFAEAAAARPAAPAGPAGVDSDTVGADAPGPRLLVVRLLRRTQRDELVRAARVRRGADTTGLGLPGPPRRFYVNERLTLSNRLMFRRAREEARRLDWKFAWTREGAVLVRRTHGDPAMRIRTVDDLDRVFGAKIVSNE